MDQLLAIISHIEDLEVVTFRVSKSEKTSGYMDPLPSDKSDIRIDY